MTPKPDPVPCPVEVRDHVRATVDRLGIDGAMMALGLRRNYALLCLMAGAPCYPATLERASNHMTRGVE